MTGQIEVMEYQSSNIAKSAYHQAGQILDVEFSNGHTYRYFDVPPDVYQGMVAIGKMEHGSVGTYFNKAIKEGGYKFRKLNMEQQEEK